MLSQQRKSSTSGRVVFDTSLSEDVYNYTPINCFFLDFEDPLKLRLAYALSSILTTLYSRVPRSLEQISEALNYHLIKYNLEDPIDLSYLMHYRNIIRKICIKCGDDRICPWASAIRSLRIS